MRLKRSSEDMMTYIPRFAIAACALAVGISAANAQGGQDHAHHPGNQAPAQAQPAPPARGTSMMEGGKGGMMPMPEMMQMMHRMMAACGGAGTGNPAGMSGLRHIEGQLAYYKAELGITDAQLPQWNTLADAVRASAKTLQQAHLQAVQPAGSLSAPEQMARRMSTLSVLIEAQKPVESPLKSLYGVLLDEQKKTADALMAEHLQAMQASEM